MTEVISLANTTVLKQLELVITSDSAHHKMLSAIRQSDNIEALKLDYNLIKEWVADVTLLLEHSKALKHLTIKNYENHNIVLMLTDSLSVNTSVRQFKYGGCYMDQTTTLIFLEKVKQAYTVEKIIVGVSARAYYDYQFSRDVEKKVQQINHTRSTRGMSSLLNVDIVHWSRV